jgi:hypothetical protein
MTPQREEAARLLRLARRDEAAFNALLGAPEAGEEELRLLTPYAVEYRHDDVPCVVSRLEAKCHESPFDRLRANGKQN